MKLNVVVEEENDPIFVAQIGNNEYENLGDEGLEEIARDFCKREGYTFVDIAI